MEDTLQAVRERGVDVLLGRWLVEGSPYVVLFDLACAKPHLDSWIEELEQVVEVNDSAF
jgi:glycogen(starch) synthase